jgi:hypothetical protein
MLWQCDLIDDGIVRERFFREGATANEVKEDLESFQWGRGKWRISDAKDDEDG